MQWTPEADRLLFLSILNQQDVKVDNKAVAAALHTEENPCTPRAVDERLRKLKKMALDSKDSPAEDDGEAGEPVPTPAKPKATPRKKKAAVDEDGNPTPTKKRRQTPKKKANAPEADSTLAAVAVTHDGNESAKHEEVDQA